MASVANLFAFFGLAMVYDSGGLCPWHLFMDELGNSSFVERADHGLGLWIMGLVGCTIGFPLGLAGTVRRSPSRVLSHVAGSLACPGHG